MDDQDIFEKVRGIVVKQLGITPSQVVMDSSFLKDLGADSLTSYELIWALEDGFSVEIPDEKVMDIRTVGDAVHCLKAHLA
ncbi:MAG: acyl carrier protein [Sphaerochaetaceae bacterium]